MRPIGRQEIAEGLRRSLLIGVAIIGIGLLVSPDPSAEQPSSSGSATARAQQMMHAPVANLRGEAASADVRRIVEWIAASGDAGGADFLIVDKRNAKLYVFDRAAQLRGAAPILLGSAVGDDTVPGVGGKKLADVLPRERTTPAGRFVGEIGRNARGEDVVWVDYDAGVSMHRVLTTNRKERRLERLATPTIADNRISYGCINVPVAFFEQYVTPAFARQNAIVYVLPEAKTLEQVFVSYQPLEHRGPLFKSIQLRQAHGG